MAKYLGLSLVLSLVQGSGEDGEEQREATQAKAVTAQFTPAQEATAATAMAVLLHFRAARALWEVMQSYDPALDSGPWLALWRSNRGGAWQPVVSSLSLQDPLPQSVRLENSRPRLVVVEARQVML